MYGLEDINIFCESIMAQNMPKKGKLVMKIENYKFLVISFPFCMSRICVIRVILRAHLVS